MKKGFIIGAVFGVLIVPVATLGLAIRFFEVIGRPLTYVPRIIVSNLIDTATTSGGISIGLMILTSAIFYSIIGGVIGYLYSKFKSPDIS